MNSLLVHINHLLYGSSISIIFILALFFTIVIYVLINKPKFIHPPRLFDILIVLIFAGLFISYVGFLFSILFMLLLLGSLCAGIKLLSFSKEPILGTIIAFFGLVEIYTLFGLTTNPTIAIIIVIVLSVLSISYQSSENLTILQNLKEESIRLQKTLTFVDYWLIVFCFLLGSLPQTIWDAAQANLYNAKWYILTNSFAPLPESISSLFPQNAISYYSLFYKIGSIKGIEFSIFLPLLFFLYLIKKYIISLKAPKIFSWIITCLIVTPMVVFQATNGYYDLLVATIIFLALYLITFTPHPKLNANLLLGAFFIGFAAAMKYFPIVFVFLPISFIIKEKASFLKKLFLITISALLSLLPLGIWAARAYKLTHSPVFPFFQHYFPTPQFWPVTYILDKSIENTPMIQTAMNAKQWATGGFLTYPIMTYFHTEFFLESPHGFSGIAFILLIPYTAIIFIYFIKKLLSKSLNKFDYLYGYLFLAYFAVGLITRYYRYLWPYQLIFALFALVPLIPFLTRHWVKIGASTIIVFVLVFNLKNIKDSYTFIPIFRERLLKPDYYFTAIAKNDPITFLNNEIAGNKNVTIADMGRYNPGRFNITNRVYQCTWYWIGLIDILDKANTDPSYATNLLEQFDYIIVDTPIADDKSLCHYVVVNNLDKTKVVYQDQTYTILKVLK